MTKVLPFPEHREGLEYNLCFPPYAWAGVGVGLILGAIFEIKQLEKIIF